MSFLDFLSKIASLPHDLWKSSNENARTGASEFEEETQRFWGKFAVVVTLIGAIGYGVWKWMTSL